MPLLSKCETVKLFIVTVLLSTVAHSQSRPPTARLVKPDALRSVTVLITEGKKNSSITIQCLASSPGKASRAKKGMMRFVSFANLSKSTTNKKLKNRYKLLAKQGRAACATPGNGSPDPSNPGSPPGSAPPNSPPSSPPASPSDPSQPLPDHLSMERYTGPFGPTEARILFERFAFGASPEQISEAVALGLEGTVNKLLTVSAEPELDALASDIECDSWITGDPAAGNQNRICDANDINDFSRSGQRTAWLYRMIHSKNAFQERLRLFAHDERLSVSHTAARDCERHAIRTYMNDLWNLATTGDYKAYMRAMNNSHLVHLRWLDGAANQGGVVKNRPNENYAREFWELGTVGPTDLNGQPVYTDFDVAQASLALTGWTINSVTIEDKQVCLAARSPLLHTPGMKTIFAGTPYEAAIDDDEDLLEATFAHPRTAEHLAEDIFKQFINYAATPDSIRALAAILRANNHNLLPTFKQVMMSKAVYAPQSRGALVKHSLERVVSFLKTSRFPVSYRRLDSIVSQLEQQPLNPPSVFGWDERKNASDSMLLAWRNTVINEFINIDVKQVKERTGYSYYDRFVADLNRQGLTSSNDVITRLAQDLGIQLTDKQRATIDQFLNFSATSSGCPAQCSGGSYRLERDKYDTDPGSKESGMDWGGQEKIRGAVTLMLTTRDALLK